MKSTLYGFLICALLAGCQRSPEVEAVKRDFVKNRKYFEQLRGMVIDDIGGRECLTIGLDHIGEYRTSYADLTELLMKNRLQWHHEKSLSEDVGLEVVLRSVGLKKRRYDKYLARFRKTGIPLVVYCRNPGWYRAIVHSTGISVSGCTTSININDTKNLPQTEVWTGGSKIITPLSDGWYVVEHCT